LPPAAAAANMTKRNVPPNCTRCGLCREVCLAEKLGQHTITSLLSGGDEYSAWLCSCCQLCQEVCPEGVDVHRVIIEERREGTPTEPFRRSFDNIRRFGYAFAIGEEINDLRAAHGLKPVQLVSPGRVRLLLHRASEDGAGPEPTPQGGGG